MIITTEAQRAPETGAIKKVDDHETDLGHEDTAEVESEGVEDDQALALAAPSLAGLSALAGALKQTRGARIASVLAKKSTRKASRAVRAGVDNAKAKGPKILAAAKRRGDAAAKTGIGQGTQHSTNDKGELETDETLEWTLRAPAPLEVPIPAVPGLSVSVAPSAKLVAHAVGTDSITTFKLNVEGTMASALNYGVPNVLQAYGGCDGILSGGGTLHVDASMWSLGAELEATSVFKVGIKYGGFGDWNYKVAETKLLTISGLKWTAKGPECDVKVKWHPEIEAMFANLQTAAKKAEATLNTIKDPTKAVANIGANVRKLFPF